MNKMNRRNDSITAQIGQRGGNAGRSRKANLLICWWVVLGSNQRPID